MTIDEENQLWVLSLYVNGILSYHEAHENYYKKGDEEKHGVINTIAAEFIRLGYAKNESRTGGDVSVLNTRGERYFEGLKEKDQEEKIATAKKIKEEKRESNWWTRDNYNNPKWIIGTILVICGLVIAYLGLYIK